MQQGRWKSERMVIRYGQRIAAIQSAMAQLLKAEAKASSEKDNFKQEK